MWKELLVHASAFDEKFSHGLGLPQSHAELQAFIEAVDLFLQGFLTAFGYAEKAMETKKATKSRDAEENTYYCQRFWSRNDPRRAMYGFLSRAKEKDHIHNIVRLAQECTNISVLWILEEKSCRLEPAGLALVTNKQICLPGSGELCL